MRRRVARLSTFDITRYFKTLPRVVVEFGFGVACAVAMMLLRMGVDQFAPTAGPFALVYPTVLVATLFGHLLAGLTTFAVAFIWAWWYVLPTVGSFHFEVETDPSRVLINAMACIVIIMLAEIFRRAVQTSVRSRDLEIERRRMLMVELEHRTKNNFAIVASLLGIQKRRVNDGQAVGAIEQAIDKVHTFAQAYALMTLKEGEGFEVALRSYLTDLVERLAKASFDSNVDVIVEIEEDIVPRQVAVNLGLFVNEALTNCAKYAFFDGRRGTVRVTYLRSGQGWVLGIHDDGVGLSRTSDQNKAGSGLGKSLMQAFAVEADAEMFEAQGENGFTIGLRRRVD